MSKTELHRFLLSNRHGEFNTATFPIEELFAHTVYEEAEGIESVWREVGHFTMMVGKSFSRGAYLNADYGSVVPGDDERLRVYAGLQNDNEAVRLLDLSRGPALIASSVRMGELIVGRHDPALETPLVTVTHDLASGSLLVSAAGDTDIHALSQFAPRFISL
jgi:hypothetical protein